MYLSNVRISLRFDKRITFLSSFIAPKNYTQEYLAPRLHVFHYEMYKLFSGMELNEYGLNLV